MVGGGEPGTRPAPGAGSRTGAAPVHVPVQDTLLRALAVLRVLVLLNAVVIYARHARGYDHPAAGWAVLAAMAAWTGFVVWACARPAWRRTWLLLVDLAVAAAAILVSAYVKGPGLNATVPGFWVMGVVLAWAVLRRWPGGLLAAVVVSAADVAVRDHLSQKAYGNIFLLLVGGLIVGFLSELLQRTAAERDRAEREAAAAAERQRLARLVHDGVLQVLALVQRHAPELGGQGVELGRLAGEQEVRLRALVQQAPPEQVPTTAGRTSDAAVDLAATIGALATATVHVALPGGPVLAPAAVARELTAAVEACLSNVRHHVGRDAEAWVLLEELPDRWVVVVRDRGPGIPEGRLGDAAAQGRLGVSQSVRGRLEDLGGTATLRTGAGQGTEWELGVPR
ncbi:MAG: hypothetical protein JWR20_2354 [Marmoricola sp.]|nr:hypothetical protein [Marmoricola sp.]